MAIFVQLASWCWALGAIYPASAGDGRAVNPTRTHCQVTHLMPCSRIIVVHCRLMGEIGWCHPSKVPLCVNLGHLNSATPMNGLLSKDTPDLSNNELSLICLETYNTTHGKS